MASDFAIVFGRTGRMLSAFSKNAVATGEHPAAWAPETRTESPSGISPSRPSSWKPLCTLVSWLPDATGTTT